VTFVRACLTAILLAACALPIARPAQGQTYPNRPIKVIVPFPAGGPTDILARVVAQRLSEVWGQGVVIENQPGANTAIAAARVAKMPADGYTLFAVMDVTMVLNPMNGITRVLMGHVNKPRADGAQFIHAGDNYHRC